MATNKSFIQKVAEDIEETFTGKTNQRLKPIPTVFVEGSNKNPQTAKAKAVAREKAKNEFIAKKVKQADSLSKQNRNLKHSLRRSTSLHSKTRRKERALAHRYNKSKKVERHLRNQLKRSKQQQVNLKRHYQKLQRKAKRASRKRGGSSSDAKAFKKLMLMLKRMQRELNVLKQADRNLLKQIKRSKSTRKRAIRRRRKPTMRSRRRVIRRRRKPTVRTRRRVIRRRRKPTVRSRRRVIRRRRKPTVRNRRRVIRRRRKPMVRSRRRIIRRRRKPTVRSRRKVIRRRKPTVRSRRRVIRRRKPTIRSRRKVIRRRKPTVRTRRRVASKRKRRNFFRNIKRKAKAHFKPKNILRRFNPVSRFKRSRKRLRKIFRRRRRR